MKIGVLRGRVVPPDNHVAYVVHRCAGFLGKLGFGAVVIQPHHGGKLPRIHIRRITLCD